jgi:glycosyltransferase involved in cell wall biosynthesis
LARNALPEYGITSSTEANTVIFSGNLEYHPKVEAVRWFAAEIWPAVRARHPDLEWRLVGCNPHAVEGLVGGLPGARLIGPVEDALREIAAGSVAVVPLRSGSGTRFKILEAWAAGRAVVSTSIGAKGLGARDGEHLVIADTAEAFASAISAVLVDTPLRVRLGAAGRELYLKKFTWTAAWGRLDEQGRLTSR